MNDALYEQVFWDTALQAIPFILNIGDPIGFAFQLYFTIYPVSDNQGINILVGLAAEIITKKIVFCGVPRLIKSLSSDIIQKGIKEASETAQEQIGKNIVNELSDGCKKELADLGITSEKQIVESIVSNDTKVIGILTDDVAPCFIKDGAGNVGTSLRPGTQVGNLGTIVENPNLTLNWTNARTHALNRMNQQGITQEVFENLVKNGVPIRQDASTFLFLNRSGVAVVSELGIPQTVYMADKFKPHIVEALIQVFGK